MGMGPCFFYAAIRSGMTSSFPFPLVVVAELDLLVRLGVPEPSRAVETPLAPVPVPALAAPDILRAILRIELMIIPGE